VTKLESLPSMDYVVHEFVGERLTLHGGMDTSCWSDVEVVFEGVMYLALPTYMNSVTFRRRTNPDPRSINANLNPAEEGLTAYDIIEDDDWPEGRRIHLVLAARAVASRKR